MFVLVRLSFFSGKRPPPLRDEPKYDHLKSTSCPQGTGVTLYGLSVLHRRQREREREKRIQYCREQVGGNKQNESITFLLMLIDGRAQNTFFENIRQMREAAEASISPLPSHGYQRDRDSSHSPLTGRRDSGDVSQVMPTQYAPQRSGLRHYLEEDDSRVDNGSMIVINFSINRIQPGILVSNPLISQPNDF